MFEAPLLRLPLALTCLRAALAPLVIILSVWYPNPVALGICLVLAFLSDIFDGMIARRLRVATSILRRLDSVADSAFYLAACFAAWHLYPQVVRDHATPLIVLATLEFARYVLDFFKFGREASYHMWSSKLWGLTLFVGFFSLLVLGKPGEWINLTIYVGIFADLEGVAISLILSSWQVDVPTIFHANKLRRIYGRAADAN